MDEAVRLTQLSHGGGCGCKIAPGVLQQILATHAPGILPPQLLVGIETSDDAAVYQLNEQQALIATTDFFMPIVDDPFDFGRIAATNALSDVYAMGGTPILALAIVGMPINRLPLTTIGRILEGGAAVCQAAGIPLAGGHSIDSVEPIYGLVALGLINPKNLKRNSSAKAGDRLVLGKALGVGAFSAAYKKGLLLPHDYETMRDSTTQLNTPGAMLACLEGVHAMTDVTGFGLLGHLLEMCRGSRLSAKLQFDHIPVFPGVLDLIAGGAVTGASARNWESYGQEVVLGEALGLKERQLLTDPQTSGGLLVSCTAETVTEVLSIFLQQGFNHVSVIGEMQPASGPVQVVVD